jgi:1-acyl-sn-glycerol-3-phosphate acyltransferase
MNSPFFRLLYSAWCVFLFGLLIVLTFPVVWLGLRRREWYGLAHRATRLIGQGFFIGALLPVRIEHRFRPDPKQPYIYCINHFSYMDIALLGTIVPGMYAFIGKTGVQKVPLFGYMFSRLHVMVDRNDPNSRARSLKQSLQLLREGRPMIVFPEGGMRSTNPPQMAPFMDGAFAMAIQQQVPIVPITLLNDYRVLPNAKKLRMRWEPIQVVFHPPVLTTGLTMSDIEPLKKQVFAIIQQELSGATQKATEKNTQLNSTIAA